MSGDARELEARWRREMLSIYAEAKVIGYNASHFIQLVNSDGGLAAARRLISSDVPSDGFTELWERRRLDLAVESRALKPGFRPLFTDLEIAMCRRRLADYRGLPGLPGGVGLTRPRALLVEQIVRACPEYERSESQVPQSK